MSHPHHHQSEGDSALRTPERDPRLRWPPWVRLWTVMCTLAGGVLALLWLLLRSGSKPSRFAYPCQQAAFGTAAVALGVPFVTAGISCRRRIVATVRTPGGKIAGATLGVLAAVMLAVASAERAQDAPILQIPADHHPDVYVINEARGIEPGRYGGVDDLLELMGASGLKWYRSAEVGSTSGPEGLIDAEDVVLIKINGQWDDRGGTNTDVLRGVIRRIVEHPDGFVGEIIVADNEQFRYGDLDWPENNAEDRSQSAQDVVDDFAAEGWGVSTSLWKAIRSASVAEYSEGDMTSGYVVDPSLDPQTQIRVSYPKFRSAFGTYVSYKHGVWSPSSQTYDPDELVVINMPVLKTHYIYAITASVKNHMGVVTTALSTDSHNGVGRGGLGSVMAEVRLPDLTILDCVWILARPGSGPSASYENATRRDQLLAGTDPAALDMWAVKYIMIPQIIENGYTYNDYHTTQDPDNPTSVFRNYLDRTMNELLLAGIPATNDIGAVNARLWPGDLDLDGDVDNSDLLDLASCLAGPEQTVPPECRQADYDRDGKVDLADMAIFQRAFTGAS